MKEPSRSRGNSVTTAFNTHDVADAGGRAARGLTLLPDEALAVHGLHEDEVAEDGALQHHALSCFTAGNTSAKSDTATKALGTSNYILESGRNSYLQFQIFSEHIRASKRGTVSEPATLFGLDNVTFRTARQL